MHARSHGLVFALASIILSACANGPGPASQDAPTPTLIVPIPIEKSFLAGEGLTPEDPSGYEDYTRQSEGSESESRGESRSTAHIFHEDKIHVSVIEAGPGKVRVEGLPYDEFIQILEGRLILTLDDGQEFRFEKGDSLILPKGWMGEWHMPERYRELVVVDTEGL